MNTNINKSEIRLEVATVPGLELRSASQTDLENLRTWKNKEKQYFFYQEEISKELQLNWFESFKLRPDDFMFMTVFEGHVFGCMGIRWQKDFWDVYNVIVGLPEFSGR